MGNKLKRMLIGRPLKNEDIHGQKLNVAWGLPILASDAMSSVAYASEEILLVLIGVGSLGVASYTYLGYISATIIGLLFILIFSYLQTIQEYPNGGGAYIVATDNLGKIPGLIAGSALTVDYILTVAVSISSGTAAIISAFPQLQKYTIPICLIILVLLMVGNLRGMRESSRMFSIPAYAFFIAIMSMIVMGLYRYFMGLPPQVHPLPLQQEQLNVVSVVVLLRAFSNGCAALTGIEAVSNAVPAFKEPSVKNAKKVLVLLAFVVFLLFGGTSLMANLYHAVPNETQTVLSQIAAQIFGKGLMFYYIQLATTVILAMAANTAFSGFPLLVSIMAKEGYAPRQLSMRGDRLSYSNGILLLTGLAAVLIVTFNGNTSRLIGLYAIGVFISFTLSQFGMFRRWLKNKGKHWHYKAFINGFGALVTSVVVVIIAVFKFYEGAWIVIIVVPTLTMLMFKVKKHYNSVAMQLKMSNEELSMTDIVNDHYRNRVIVPIESINKASVRALRYARTISDNVVAFTVCIDSESAQKIKEKYSLLNTDIPLIVKYSPFRKVVEPLLRFIESEEYDYQKGDMITVILAQFAVKKWWHNILHNHSRVFIEQELMKHKHIVVSTMPLQLKNDDIIISNNKNKTK